MVTLYIRHKQKQITNYTKRIAIECLRNTSTRPLHEEVSILLLKQHIYLYPSQLRQKAQYPGHTLHKFTLQSRQRDMK